MEESDGGGSSSGDERQQERQEEEHAELGIPSSSSGFSSKTGPIPHIDLTEENESAEPEEPKKEMLGGTAECPICLEQTQNTALADQCFHAFCFACILQWAEVTARCPLCKQPFRSVIHSIVSDREYRRYYLPESLLDSGDGPKREPRPQSAFAGGLPRRVHSRPAWGQSAQPPAACSAVEARRAVYQRGVPCQTLMSAHARPPIRPATFREPVLRRKLEPWLRRELQAALEEDDVDALDMMCHFVFSLLGQHEIASPRVREELQPFLLGKTGLFLHELEAFARSPYDQRTYDRLPAGPEPPPGSPSRRGRRPRRSCASSNASRSRRVAATARSASARPRPAPAGGAADCSCGAFAARRSEPQPQRGARRSATGGGRRGAQRIGRGRGGGGPAAARGRARVERRAQRAAAQAAEKARPQPQPKPEPQPEPQPEREPGPETKRGGGRGGGAGPGELEARLAGIERELARQRARLLELGPAAPAPAAPSAPDPAPRLGAAS
eukprot:tig00020723_g13436.t1